MNLIDRNAVCEMLHELSNIDEQRRLWLSTGANQSDVSSFSEAVEQLYIDTGLADSLVDGTTGYPKKVADGLIELQALLKTVNHRNGPQATINDPRMNFVRELASEILRLIEK